jgi:hypothetical protein
MIQSQHRLSFCEQCECMMITCGVCGNNCCNGCTGMIDGVPCYACREAYEHQDIWMNDHDAIIFVGMEHVSPIAEGVMP